MTNVIAPGKAKEDRVYVEKSQGIFDKNGVPRRVWRVEGRKKDQVLLEFGPFEGQKDFEAARAKMGADKERQVLWQEALEAGVWVPGTEEWFILTDD